MTSTITVLDTILQPYMGGESALQDAQHSALAVLRQLMLAEHGNTEQRLRNASDALADCQRQMLAAGMPSHLQRMVRPYLGRHQASREA